MTVTEEVLVEQARDPRLKILLSYLAADPGNAALKADAAEQALGASEPEIARRVLGSDLRKLDERALNICGLANMELGTFADAAQCFRELLDRVGNEPAVEFSLAWSLSMQKDFDGALRHLTDEVTARLPQAAMLEIQLLHDRGEFDGAAEKARHHLKLHPEHVGLSAAVSVLALDLEDRGLARACAEVAGAHPDAQATLGTLALGDQQVDAAIAHFDRALEVSQSIPRAWVGRGLARLVSNDAAGAATDIDRGAELFQDHIGSWIASGWAYLLAGDRIQSRNRFERALLIDENFGESHGSLAVLDALEGREADARRRIKVALGLDRKGFSARLAQSLLTAAEGNQQSARQFFDKILESPVNDRGDTAAQALVNLGLR